MAARACALALVPLRRGLPAAGRRRLGARLPAPVPAAPALAAGRSAALLGCWQRTASRAVASGAGEEEGKEDQEEKVEAKEGTEAGNEPLEEEREASEAAVEVVPRDILQEQDVLDARARHETMRLPRAWQSPGEWVDLEFERAGLNGAGGPGSLASPWGSPDFPHPDMNVLWPNRTLSEHRRRPFTLPREAKKAVERGDAAKKAAEEQLEANRQRLCTLWRMSRSHGISWDELDRAYVTFAQAGQRRQEEWKRRDQETKKALSQQQKEEAWRRATQYLRRFCPQGKKPEDYYPSRTKRLAARVYSRAKRRWFSPFRPGRLAGHLQQLVAARMARRETEERTFNLQPKAP